MKPEIIATGRFEVEKCTIEGCDKAATAFLEYSKESAGKTIINRREGYCTEHAKEKHEAMKADLRYNTESFEKPRTL